MFSGDALPKLQCWFYSQPRLLKVFISLIVVATSLLGVYILLALPENTSWVHGLQLPLKAIIGVIGVSLVGYLTVALVWTRPVEVTVRGDEVRAPPIEKNKVAGVKMRAKSIEAAKPEVLGVQAAVGQEGAGEARDRLAQDMTRERIEQGQELSRNWKPKEQKK